MRLRQFYYRVVRWFTQATRATYHNRESFIIKVPVQIRPVAEEDVTEPVSYPQFGNTDNTTTPVIQTITNLVSIILTIAAIVAIPLIAFIAFLKFRKK